MVRAAGCMLLSLLLMGFVAAGQDDETRRVLKLFVTELVPIKPGQGQFPATFVMGSKTGTANERPQREVQLRPFMISKYEVTQELYERVTGKNPSKWKGKRNSVEMVSWDEANAFADQLNKLLMQEKIMSDKEEFRLPSEAEWEYCCRAGTTTAYSFGDNPGDLGQFAWFHGNAKGNDPPVGAKKPNPWGLYDMHGYVWEWCLDSWQPNYEGATNDGSPKKVRDAKERVLRGGSWADEAEQARSAYRHHLPASERSDAVGFRLVIAAKRD